MVLAMSVPSSHLTQATWDHPGWGQRGQGCDSGKEASVGGFALYFLPSSPSLQSEPKGSPLEKIKEEECLKIFK